MLTTRTRIDVLARTGSATRVRLGHGLLQARRVRSRHGTVAVALIAGQALLLAGDEVAVDVRVDGPVVVELSEPTGTVAFDMRADPASRGARWDVRVAAANGARVRWHGQPFVVAGGAAVERSTTISVEDDSVVAWRESVVLGRTGELGGSLRAATSATLAGRTVLVEDLDLSPAYAAGWGILAGQRCLDMLTVVGERLPESADVLQLEETGSIRRWLGRDLHRSPLHHPEWL